MAAIGVLCLLASIYDALIRPQLVSLDHEEGKCQAAGVAQCEAATCRPRHVVLPRLFLVYTRRHAHADGRRRQTRRHRRFARAALRLDVLGSIGPYFALYV